MDKETQEEPPSGMTWRQAPVIFPWVAGQLLLLVFAPQLVGRRLARTKSERAAQRDSHARGALLLRLRAINEPIEEARAAFVPYCPSSPVPSKIPSPEPPLPPELTRLLHFERDLRSGHGPREVPEQTRRDLQRQRKLAEEWLRAANEALSRLPPLPPSRYAPPARGPFAIQPQPHPPRAPRRPSVARGILERLAVALFAGCVLVGTAVEERVRRLWRRGRK